jgi:hypothetical protein
MMEILKTIYTFQERNSTLIATTTTNGLKVVITAFSSNKVLIQGAGCKLWQFTIFRVLSEKLNRPASQSNQSHRDLDTPTTSRNNSNSKHSYTPQNFNPRASPKNLLTSLATKLSPVFISRPSNNKQNSKTKKNKDLYTSKYTLQPEWN